MRPLSLKPPFCLALYKMQATVSFIRRYGLLRINIIPVLRRFPDIPPNIAVRSSFRHVGVPPQHQSLKCPPPTVKTLAEIGHCDLLTPALLGVIDGRNQPPTNPPLPSLMTESASHEGAQPYMVRSLPGRPAKRRKVAKEGVTSPFAKGG